MKNRKFPTWYRALSLRERLRLREAGPPTVAVDVERGERRLKRWCAQPPFDTADLFQQRLADDGMTAGDLVTLLGETWEPGAEDGSRPPAWVTTLLESFSAPGTGPPLAEPPLALPPQWQTVAGHEFWSLVEPIVRSAFQTLASRVADLLVHDPGAPLRAEGIERVLRSTLPQELIAWPLRAMVLELNVARLQGDLKSEDPRGRFQEFVDRLQDRDRALGLLAEYPVLARALVGCMARWSSATLELLQRLCHDWPEIVRAFPGLDDRDVLLDVQAGAGDRHRGGRSVAVLSFRSGCKLVYKPRPLAVDTLFQSLLGTLGQWGHQPSFRTFAILERDGYGWMEHVMARGCDSAAEARRFYQRQGGFLALLYLLRASDVHFENVIAAGEHPVIVDLESILQPGLPLDNPQAGDFLLESIVQIGLLPIRNWENETSPGLDVSALGGPDGQLPPRPEPYWEGEATDQMRFARRVRPITAQNQHRPALAGRPLLALDFTDEIIAGFKGVYRLLLAHRDELLADNGLLAPFARQEVRVLLRSTAVYGLMLRESFHPDFLGDGLERDRFFDKLWVQVPQRPFLRRVIGAEQRALWEGDIPLFTASPGSRALRSGGGEVVDGFFAESGMDRVRRRLQGLGEKDLSRQEWFIRASIAILSTKSPEVEVGHQGALSPASAAGVPSGKLEQLAARIGDRLCDWAMEDETSVSWLGLQPTRQGAYKITLINENLYSGQAGITLFLAYLGALGGGEKYTALAQKSCRALLQSSEAAGFSDRLGAFEGLGGIIYLLCHLAALWRQPALLDAAEHFAERVQELAETDEQFDVINGSAGCIIGLASLFRRRPSPAVLAAMLRCGERIAQCGIRTPLGLGWVTTYEAKVPMTGFSHGSAGIAAALLELAALSGEARFRELAFEALQYERSLFCAEQGNWPDMRAAEDRSGLVNWCHGAPGIGLGRLMILRHQDTPEIREEVAVAVKTTLARGFGRNHCLCHGELGNLDLLLSARPHLPGLELAGEIRRLTAGIVEDIERSGWRCGLPMGVETPGLMTGVSGIGYGLLRLAAPERVPSVLSLEPPASGH